MNPVKQARAGVRHHCDVAALGGDLRVDELQIYRAYGTGKTLI